MSRYSTAQAHLDARRLKIAHEGYDHFERHLMAESISGVLQGAFYQINRANNLEKATSTCYTVSVCTDVVFDEQGYADFAESIKAGLIDDGFSCTLETTPEVVFPYHGIEDKPGNIRIHIDWSDKPSDASQGHADTA